MVSDAIYIGLGFVGSFSFGLTAVILKTGVKNQDIFSGMLYRVLGALPLLILFNLVFIGVDFFVPFLDVITFALLTFTSVILITGDLLLMHILKSKPVGVITPLMATNPLFTTLLLFFTQEANVTLYVLVLTIIIIGGVFLVTYDNSTQTSTSFDREALLYGMGIAVLWGLMLYIEILLLDRDGVNGLSYSAMKILVLALIGAVFVIIRQNKAVSTQKSVISSSSTKYYLMLAGLVGWMIGSILVYTALGGGPVAILAPIIGLNPLFAVLLSLVLGQESMNVTKGLGIVLCIGCSILLII